MTFEKFVREQSDRISQPIAALVALTDVELDELPEDDRRTLLELLRVYAVEASEIASELHTFTRRTDIEIDLRSPVETDRAA